MGYWDRPDPNSKAPLPERLLRLDRELSTERTKDFENLWAVRGEFRFKIAVFRNGNQGFAATVRLDGKTHRRVALLPSDAYTSIAEQLKFEMFKIESDRQFAMSRNEMPSAA